MRSKARSAAGLAVALLALLLSFGFPYSLVSEYGGAGGSLLAAVVLGPVLALGAWLMFRRPLWSLTGGLVLSVAAAATGGLLGEAEHDRVRQVRAEACSPDERTEFQALGAIPTNGEYGWGNDDGSCAAAFGGRTRSSVDDLRQAIEGRDWKPDGAETYMRDGKRLRVAVTDEGGKGLDITLVIP
jgi:hypothetical protein